MARQKTLRSPDHYLKPTKTKAGGNAVVSSLSRMEKAGMAVSVKRIQPQGGR